MVDQEKDKDMTKKETKKKKCLIHIVLYSRVAQYTNTHTPPFI